MASEMLVDGVVDRFPHQVVKARAIVHIADVHTRPLAHRFKAFERGDAAGIVSGIVGRRLRGSGRLSSWFSHGIGGARLKRNRQGRLRGGGRLSQPRYGTVAKR